ncbi:MAG: hypothetical protein QM713_15295 [Arachnia sp.]
MQYTSRRPGPISRRAALGGVVLAGALAASGCAAEKRVAPKVRSQASRVWLYSSLAELAEDSTAIVLVKVTGDKWRTGPYSDSKHRLVTVTLTRLISGELSVGSERGTEFLVYDAVGPDVDGNPALATGWSFLMFLQPMAYGVNDPHPDGAYVQIGGPSGAFAEVEDGVFDRIDEETALPTRVTLAEVEPLQAGKTEEQVLAEGAEGQRGVRR